MKNLILMYHGFGKGDKYTLSYKRLVHDLRKLKRRGYEFCTFSEIGDLKKKQVCITFDDGYSSNYRAFKILEKFEVKGTFFIISDRIGKEGYLTKDQISEMSRAGHEIGSHTTDHKTLTEMSQDELEVTLRESRKVLEKITGKPAKTMSVPGGVYNQKVLETCRRYYERVRTSDIEVLNYIPKEGIYPALPMQKNFPKTYCLSSWKIKSIAFAKEVKKIKPLQQVKGNAIFHAHTKYSDGSDSLTELKKWCIQNSINIVFLSDHSNFFDKAKFEKYKKECKSLSDEQFVFVPCLEVASTEDVHIIYLNPKEIPKKDSAEKMLKEAKRKDLKTVIAHVDPERFHSDADLIEIFNAKQNKKITPLKVFGNLNKIKRENPKTQFIGGCDIHQLDKDYLVRFQMKLAKPEKLVEELVSSKFYFGNQFFGVDSYGNLYGNRLLVLLRLILDRSRKGIKNYFRRFEKLRQIYRVLFRKR